MAVEKNLDVENGLTATEVDNSECHHSRDIRVPAVYLPKVRNRAQDVSTTRLPLVVPACRYMAPSHDRSGCDLDQAVTPVGNNVQTLILHKSPGPNLLVPLDADRSQAGVDSEVCGTAQRVDD